jgi:hypothetical protein
MDFVEYEPQSPGQPLMVRTASMIKCTGWHRCLASSIHALGRKKRERWSRRIGEYVIFAQNDGVGTRAVKLWTSNGNYWRSKDGESVALVAAQCETGQTPARLDRNTCCVTDGNYFVVPGTESTIRGMTFHQRRCSLCGAHTLWYGPIDGSTE